MATDVYTRRQQEKARREGYRVAARTVAEILTTLSGGAEVTIPEHAHVQEVEKGAFVEAHLWIPRKGDPDV